MTHRIRSLLPSIGLGLLMLLSAFLAEAAGTRAEVRQSVENSMLVTGTVDIGIDGAVTGHSIDRPEKLPRVVLDLVVRTVPAFRFEPVLVNGKTVHARAKMGLRVVARQQDDGNFSLRLASADFGADKPIEGEEVVAKRMKPPVYPAAAYTANITGTVYLVIKVDREGKAEQVLVEQTNLTVLGNDRQMTRAREILEGASIAAARDWRFVIPTKGTAAMDDHWSVRVPVAFSLWSGPTSVATPYGKWRAYVPGPKQRVPWISDEENRRNPDALVAGVATRVGSGPKLLTPVGG